MNSIDLPSSVYQPGEQDYGFWPDEMFPTSQVQATTEQQDVDSYIPFSDSLDFSTYNESNFMSDFSDPIAKWDGQTMPIAHDVTGIQSAQEETCRLRAENAELKSLVEINARRVSEMETQFNAFQQWTAVVSSVLNDIQLKQQGLSPLQKQFGRIMSPPTTRKRRARIQENKRETDRVKPKKNTEQGRASM